MSLKVYGSLTFCRIEGHVEQVRTIIAAKNKTRVANILGVSPYVVKSEWTETGNKEEHRVALRAPGVVFIKWKGEFVRRRSVVK